MTLANLALDNTLALIAIFGGIGVLVNGIVVYIVVQVLGEHRENEELRARANRADG
jgi:hypothetical protein